MSIPRRFQTGEAVSEFPGNSWNALVGQYWKDQDRPLRKQGTGASHGLRSAISIVIHNTTNEEIDGGGILALDGIVVDYNVADAKAELQYQVPFIKGIKYADGKQWGILQNAIENGGIANLTIMGTVWCRIDVTDAEHNNAIPVVDDVDKLQSTDDEEAVAIIWKEDGIGLKWGLVLLGGGGGGGGASLSIGRAAENIPATTGWLSETPPEQVTPPAWQEPREFDAPLEVGKGRIYRMQLIVPDEGENPLPEDHPSKPPVTMIEQTMDDPDYVPPENNVPPEPVPQVRADPVWWRNGLFDPVQKNSIVVGATIGPKTMIVAVGPTTIRRDPTA